MALLTTTSYDSILAMIPFSRSWSWRCRSVELTSFTNWSTHFICNTVITCHKHVQMRFYLLKCDNLWLLFGDLLPRCACLAACLSIWYLVQPGSVLLINWSASTQKSLLCSQRFTIWSKLTIAARLSRCSSFSVFLWIAFSNNEYLVSLCMGWTTMSMRRSLLQSFWVSHH